MSRTERTSIRDVAHGTTAERPPRDPDPQALADFLAVRPQLVGVAHRILGSAPEAEDVVQDAWVRWHGTDRSRVVNSAAFLTTVVTRLALNVRASARARRETGAGPWVPEPVDTSPDPSTCAERVEAIQVAALALLARLTPVERAIYVLREAFGYPHRHVAQILDLSEANTRQLARRARARLAQRDAVAVDPREHRRLVDELTAATHDGDLARFERFLAADVSASTDQPRRGRPRTVRRDARRAGSRPRRGPRAPALATPQTADA